MKLAWLTDVHLNFLKADERINFYMTISDTQSDAVLITGDIAEAPCLAELLIEMADHLKRPIYFVLGNHDYYRGSIPVVREQVTALTKSNKLLFWLPVTGIQNLGNNTIILGQDGWADGRLGDFFNSTVVLNDSRMIADLFQAKLLSKDKLLEKMRELADADAKELESALMVAIGKNPRKIIILTHVPPFKEACCYEGKVSDNNWLPFFSSKAIGDILLKVGQMNTSVELLVLCGHTHSRAKYQALDNLTVLTGFAEYYHPVVQKILTN